MTRTFPVLLILLMCTACAREPLDIEPEREAVRAVWNPSVSALPTPTDLVRDSASGRLALPIDPQVHTPAEQAWRGWLNTLDGYPVSSTLTLPIRGELPTDQDLSSALIVAPTTPGSSRTTMTASFDAVASVLIARPLNEDRTPGAFEPGLTYHYGLWGYDGGAQGAGGEPVVADAPFYLVRTGEPLAAHPDVLPGETREQREQVAAQLDAIGTSFMPLFETFARFGVKRDDIAVAGSFTTSARPTIWFDPDSGQIPMPNNVLLDRAQDLVQLPDSPLDDDEARHIKQVLSHYDGFSTTGAITFKATEALDASTVLDPEHVRLFRHDAQLGALIEHTELERGILQDGVTMFIRPKLALEPATTYLAVATTDITTQSGERLEAQPLSVLLRLDAAIAQEGASQVSALDDASASRLEPTRLENATMLSLMESSQGLSRDDLALAVPFRTVDAVSYMMDQRAKLYAENVRTDVVDVLDKSPNERGLPIVMRDVETIISGKLTVLDHLDRKTLRMREDGSYEERLVEFVLTIPESAKRGTPIPTVIFGHGLITSRELLYMITNKLAEAGYAAISLDLPLHGERSVCLRDSNCAGDRSTCDEERRCIDADGSPGRINAIEWIIPDGPSYPITSGEPFIIINDIEASRDHFVQAVMDLTQLVRVVRGADWAKATGGYVLDGQDMVYLGMSLGGILGSILSVVEPTIETFVLNVPGAGLLEMMENSPAFSTLFANEVAARGIESRESDAYFRFQNIIRWMLDPIDPVNVVQHAVREQGSYTDPYTGETITLPFKRVMIQMAESDSVVPNITTEILSERMGIDYRRYTPAISNHGFLFDPTSGEGRRARNDMIDFFEGRAR